MSDMSLRDIFNAILDFNLLYIIYILIGVCIIGLFLNVIKKVKTTIKKVKTKSLMFTDDETREKKLRERELEEEQDINNKEK